MSDRRRLVYSIIQFVQDEIKSDALSDDAKESLEVASQCLQSAYALTTEDKHLATASNLQTIFQLALEDELLQKKSPPSAVDKEEADRLKTECNINLLKNSLTIGTTGTETKLLPEKQLPPCPTDSTRSASDQNKSDSKAGPSGAPATAPAGATGGDTFKEADVTNMMYDSTHGQYKGEVKEEGGKLVIDGQAITVFSERDPAAINWASAGAKSVVESTGVTLEAWRQHHPGKELMLEQEQELEQEPVSVAEDTGTYLHLSTDTIGLLVIATQAKHDFNNWDPRPEDSLWNTCKSSVLTILNKLQPLLLVNCQGGVQDRMVLSIIGELCTALGQLDARAADLAGAAIAVYYQRLSGVSFLHRLLPEQERRGLDMKSKVFPWREDLRPRVQELLKAMTFSMVLTFGDSKVLASCLRGMTRPLRVHGDMDLKTASQYSSIHVVNDVACFRCNFCGQSYRKKYDAGLHTLFSHFDWQKRCDTCGLVVPVNSKGKVEHARHAGKK